MGSRFTTADRGAAAPLEGARGIESAADYATFEQPPSVGLKSHHVFSFGPQ
jgi:hypothetical protein